MQLRAYQTRPFTGWVVALAEGGGVDPPGSSRTPHAGFRDLFPRRRGTFHVRRADHSKITAVAAHSLAARPSTLAGSLSVPNLGFEPRTSRSWAGRLFPIGLDRLGADGEIRTRDPHLGKVMRYQLRYICMEPPTGIGPRDLGRTRTVLCH
jgi:hypothetical protein